MTGTNNPFFGLKHSNSTLKLMAVSKSLAQIYIYNDVKILLTIVSYASLLARSIESQYGTGLKTISSGSLFRGGWYLTKTPFSPLDKPKILDNNSKEFKEFILNIINNKHILRQIFVFDADILKFLRCYDGVVEYGKSLNIQPNTIKSYLDSGKPFKGYLFSTHRLLE